MKSLIVLDHIKVENANAISGLVYGFPAITHFLGYVHAISRELDKTLGIRLGGCGVVCHEYHVHSYKKGFWGDHVFALTKNPLTKEEKTPPFNEEGKVKMTVSLLIECDFTADDFPSHFTGALIDEDREKFKKLIATLAVTRHLAGGAIVDIQPVQFIEIPENEEKATQKFRQILRKMLPGFVLKDRPDLLQQYLSENQTLNPLDAFLDFYTLKSKARLQTDGDAEKVEWESVPKPAQGWIVPIQSGYRAISEVYKPGAVDCVRDQETPVSFVEPIYGIAQWLSPHRVRDIESIIWRYTHENEYYLCQNIMNVKI